MQVKQTRAVLVADTQGIAETPGGHKQGALTLALQQGIGGDGRTHLDVLDGIGRDGSAGRQTKQVPNTLHSRVPVATGILRKQLMAEQPPVGRFGDDIGKRAAPVYPELPHE